MKRSEMNAHERIAFDAVCEVMSELIAGAELILEDYPEDDEEYLTAKAYLSQPKDKLIDDIYKEVVNKKGVLKHLRFAGKDFIIERIDRRLTKWGY